MKKACKNVLLLFLSLALLFSCFMLIGCSCNENKNNNQNNEQVGDNTQPLSCEHEFEITATEFSCELDGHIDYKCIKCNENRIELLNAIGHDYTEWFDFYVAEINGTVLTRYCFTCDTVQYKLPNGEVVYDYDGIVEVLGGQEIHVHRNLTALSPYPPTCVTQGLEYGVQCKDCGEILIKKMTGSLGHDWEIIEQSSTEPCYKRQICKRCDYEAWTYNHDFEETVITEPTCTETGLAQYECKVCGYTKNAQLSALGHDKEVSEKVEPKCTQIGYQVWTCKVCGETGREDLFSNGHYWTIVEIIKQGNCTEFGLAKAKCSSCGLEKTVTTGKRHDKVKLVTTKLPTCTENGEGYLNCELCNANLGTISLSKRPHELYVASSQKATCTANGKEITKCKNCDYVDEEIFYALGHDDYSVTTKLPTCTETGKKETKCTRCSYYSEGIVDALGHNYNATCTEAVHIATCARCDMEEITEEHTFYVDCKTESSAVGGVTTYETVFALKCSGLSGACPYSKELARSNLEVHECSYTKEYDYDLTEPTCTQDGLFILKCAGCSEEFSRVTLPAFGHYFDYDDKCIFCGIDRFTEGLQYSLNADGNSYSVVGIGTATKETKIIIPAYYNSKPVTDIGEHAFYNRSNIQTLKISNSIKTIGNGAFYNCSSLTSVTIGNSVGSISHGAFSGCYKLVEVINKSSLNITVGSTNNGYVGYYALQVITEEPVASNFITSGDFEFYNTNGTYYLLGYTGTATDITLPENINGNNYAINQYAFYYNNKITSVVIPSGVTSIGSSAFFGCDKLVEVINKSSLNITAGSEDCGYVGYYALQVITEEPVASNFITSGDFEFYNANGTYYLLGYTGTATDITLPENINGNNYAINQYAFYNNDKITSVVITNGVTDIGDYAFSYCSKLTSVTIGANVQSIGSDAFDNCTALTEINFNATECADLSTDNYVFLYAGQSGEGIKVIIGKNVTRIPARLFYQYSSSSLSKITSVEFEEGSVCTSIGYGAFYGCYKLVEVINKSSLNITKGSYDNGYVGYYALQVITEEPVASNFITSGDFEFYNANGTYYLLGYTGTATDITLPENINGNNYSIYQYAFCYNYKITSVVIPAGVTSIGYDAFSGCYSLTNVTFEDTSTWYYTSTSNHNFTGGTQIDVTNASTNAMNLKSTYYNKYWYKV